MPLCTPHIRRMLSSVEGSDVCSLMAASSYLRSAVQDSLHIIPAEWNMSVNPQGPLTVETIVRYYTMQKAQSSHNAVADGRTFGVALMRDKIMVCWRFLPVIKIFRPPFLTISVACGFEHVLLLDACGFVHSFGMGDDGQLGHGDDASLHSPRIVSMLVSSCALQVSAGRAHSLVLTTGVSSMGSQLDTCLKAFGCNHSGQLGLGTRTGTSVPTAVVYKEGAQNLPGTQETIEFRTAKQISCGWGHSAAVTRNGELFTWGGCQAVVGQPRHQPDYVPLRPAMITRSWLEPAVDLPVFTQVVCGNLFTIALGQTAADSAPQLWATGLRLSVRHSTLRFGGSRNLQKFTRVPAPPSPPIVRLAAACFGRAVIRIREGGEAVMLGPEKPRARLIDTYGCSQVAIVDYDRQEDHESLMLLSDGQASGRTILVRCGHVLEDGLPIDEFLCPSSRLPPRQRGGMAFDVEAAIERLNTRSAEAEEPGQALRH